MTRRRAGRVSRKWSGCRVHTCQLCGASSFDYLTELQRNALDLETSPAAWMPWNYRQTLARFGPPG